MNRILIIDASESDRRLIFQPVCENMLGVSPTEYRNNFQHLLM